MTRLAEVMHEMLSASDILASAIVAKISPTDDEITTRQAYAHYGKGWIERNVKAGLLHRRRKGSAPNSPAMYSKHEILTLLQAERHVAEEAKRLIGNKVE